MLKMGDAEFTDRIGKGDVNLGYVLISSMTDIKNLSKTNLQNDENAYVCFQNAIKFLRYTLDFKLKDDPDFTKKVKEIGGKDEIINNLDEWFEFYALLIDKCYQNGFLPAEDTEFYETE